MSFKNKLFFYSSGDPSIVYIDGVTPPTSRNNLNQPSGQQDSYSSVGTTSLPDDGLTNPPGLTMILPDTQPRTLQQRSSSIGKGLGQNQLRLLQTIREDETETR